MFTNGDQNVPSPIDGTPTEAPARPGRPGSADEMRDEPALADATAELDAVEAALGRLEDGSFDRCEVCGGPIGRERLLENPLLTRCHQHAAQQ